MLWEKLALALPRVHTAVAPWTWFNSRDIFFDPFGILSEWIVIPRGSALRGVVLVFEIVLNSLLLRFLVLRLLFICAQIVFVFRPRI